MSRTTSRIMQSPWFWLIAAALLATYTLVAPRLAQLQTAGDRRPVGTADDIAALAERDDVNVLFIVIDTLRADRLGSYGYERDTSPLLDVLADRGVRFERHLSQSSWTKCSMASLWTGLYPNRTGVTRFDEVVPAAARLPAEILSDSGFRTAGVFRNGWVMGYFGFGQGFDIYARPFPTPLSANVRAENPTISSGGSDHDATASASEFLRVHGHERWFLYMHLMDVHEYLYSEETAIFGTSYSDVYDNSILWVNTVLDPFFEELAREGHLENTLIVITSDHGEAFSERGFEGHARHVYKETTEVPLIMSFPFRLEEPIVVRNRTAGVDVWPTILDLLGLPSFEQTNGRSLVPEILAAARGEQPKIDQVETPAFAYLDLNWGRQDTRKKTTLSVVNGSLRYVLYRDENGARSEEHLYDSAADPTELVDYRREEPEKLEQMRRLAENYTTDVTPAFEAEPALELEEIQLKQLRALGYDVP
jgi:arylsulfatase A-like enzyme